MSSFNQRILLHVTMLAGNDQEAAKKANETYYRINNILDGNEQLPNLREICNYCDKVNSELSVYIRNRCTAIKKKSSIFNPSINKAKSILNIVESSERRKIRIILYPGERRYIDDLTMKETTHNMIIQFVKDDSNFFPCEPHKHPPSFYQPCSSGENALRYLEALLIDACLCHYLGISDVAYHHDDKQHISKEKVLFLKELNQSGDLKFLSECAQDMVKYAASNLNESTPYISFLSIFTIAPLDKLNEKDFFLFEDYCTLWSHFQRWYFDRHGRLFSKQKPIYNPLKTVLDRNKYQGQISPKEIEEKIKELINSNINRIDNPPFGVESRFALIIIKRVYTKNLVANQFDALFSGKLHQSKWDIVYWKDLSKYKNIMQYLEVIPIIISE